jgi:hypothetical protein
MVYPCFLSVFSVSHCFLSRSATWSMRARHASSVGQVSGAGGVLDGLWGRRRTQSVCVGSQAVAAMPCPPIANTSRLRIAAMGRAANLHPGFGLSNIFGYPCAIDAVRRKPRAQLPVLATGVDMARSRIGRGRSPMLRSAAAARAAGRWSGSQAKCGSDSSAASGARSRHGQRRARLHRALRDPEPEAGC